jgi:rubrerythrin
VGGRSRVAAQMLAGKGFKKVYNVAGGIRAWQSRTAVGPRDLGVHLFSGGESPEEVLTVAYSLEEGLQDFYLSMADRAENDKVRSLFMKLSEIEVKHQASIVRAYQDLGHPDISQEDFSAMVGEKAMEGGLTTEEYLALFEPDFGSPVDVVSMAMSIEAQALDLYQRVGETVASDRSRAILMKIADEEKAHLASLGRLMDEL